MPHALKILQATSWPDCAFGEAYRSYYADVDQLCVCLLDTLAAALGQSPSPAANLYADHISSMEVAFYEALQKDAGNEPSVVCDGHRDGTTFTVLMPDADGLQYRNASTGDWKHVLLLEGAVVIQAGDIMARWSGGLVKAPEHRVLDLGGTGRLSIMFFHNPRPDCVVSPPGAPIVTAEESRQKTVSQCFHANFFSQKHYYAASPVSTRALTAHRGG